MKNHFLFPIVVLLALGQIGLSQNVSTNKKLQKTIIPVAKYTDARLKDILKDIMDQAKAADPKSDPVQLVIGAGIPADTANSTLTFNLANIPESELLKYIANLLNIKFAISDTGVTFAPLTDKSDILVTKRYDNIAQAFFGANVSTDAQRQAFLVQNGIQFPRGSEVLYDAEKNTLIIKNTQANLNMCDQLIKSYHNERAGVQVVPGDQK